MLAGVPIQDIEDEFIEKLRSLKYSYRDDIRDRAALERNFRQKFEALNRLQSRLDGVLPRAGGVAEFTG